MQGSGNKDFEIAIIPIIWFNQMMEMMVLNQRQFLNLANNDDYHLLHTTMIRESNYEFYKKNGDVAKVKVNANA